MISDKYKLDFVRKHFNLLAQNNKDFVTILGNKPEEKLERDERLRLNNVFIDVQDAGERAERVEEGKQAEQSKPSEPVGSTSDAPVPSAPTTDAQSELPLQPTEEESPSPAPGEPSEGALADPTPSEPDGVAPGDSSDA